MFRFPVLLICILIAGCRSVKAPYFASQLQVSERPVTQKMGFHPARDPLNYSDYAAWIKPKLIRVNFHFMNSQSGKYNIPEKETLEYAKNWIRIANDMLKLNEQMNLPVGNSTPVYPIPYKYIISPDPSVPGDDGVYYHIDDELCYVVKTGREQNINDRDVIKKYAIRNDSVLNIFVQSHHLDSIHSPTYRPDHSGISLGSSIKSFGRWQENPNPYGLKSITNHEIAHSLGLSHSWSGNDGCDDTPNHPNCYNITDDPKCAVISNNMMDYNVIMRALTPCQIGKILMNMGRQGSLQRNLLVRDWCVLDTAAHYHIRTNTKWSGNLDLNSHITVHEGITLEIAADVSLPEKALIHLNEGSQLIITSTGKLYNDCGNYFGGIILHGNKKTIGKIIVEKGGIIDLPGFIDNNIK